MNAAAPLNRPAPAVRALSILLILSPILVLVMSFIAAGARDWYKPENFARLSLQLAFVDWFLFGMVMIAGLVILKQHKTTWLYSCMILAFASAAILFNVREPDGVNMLTEAWGVELGFAVFLACGILVVINYSRYPYLDRRAGWLNPAAERFNVRLPVVIKADVGQSEDGVCENVSTSGCRVRLNREWPKTDEDEFIVLQFPDFNNIRIKAEVVVAEGQILRLKFVRYMDGNKKAFGNWILDQGDKAS